MNLKTLPVFIAAFIPIFALALAVMIERRRRQRIEKPPQQEKLLRPPGYSLAIRLDELLETAVHEMLSACALCAFAGASAMTIGSFLGAKASVLWSSLGAVAFAAFSLAGAWLALRAFRRLQEGRNVRLGLRGEQAVAETLHAVADAGLRMFHDLPGKKIRDRPGTKGWNIDHIAVGTRGVFAIETKARRRRPSRNQQAKHVVVYDGQVLRFPSGVDAGAISQAASNARDLAEFLSKITAEPVIVEPVVAVPGWYVETKGNFPVKVMNATYLAGYLRGQSEKMLPVQVQRIIAVLDERCRDLEF